MTLKNIILTNSNVVILWKLPITKAKISVESCQKMCYNKVYFNALLRSYLLNSFLGVAIFMKVSQPSWNKYEAAILLDALVKFKEGRLSKNEAVKKVSSELRQMAVNNGIKIDEIYRNENGIKLQMHSMESAYNGETISIPATQLFLNTVSIYKTDYAQFEKLLSEAKGMIYSKRNEKSEFLLWLSQKLSAGQAQEIKSALYEIEQQTKKQTSLRVRSMIRLAL